MGRELFAAADVPKISLWVEGAGPLDLLEVAGGRDVETLLALIGLMDDVG